jgi:ribonuclease HIII
MDLLKLVDVVKSKWEEYGLGVDYKPIRNGGQFKVNYKGGEFCVRAYDNKLTGVKLDWSQVRNDGVANTLTDMINGTYNVDQLDTPLYLSDDTTKMVVGSDETGKGDLFGGLVVATCAIPANRIQDIIDLGIKDSKELSDDNIINIISGMGFKMIKTEGCNQTVYHSSKYDVYVICTDHAPIHYNMRMEELDTMNDLLVEMHSDNAVTWIDLYATREVDQVIVIDQFCDPDKFETLLNYSPIPVEFMPRAERLTSVALASCFARYIFLDQLLDINNSVKDIFGITLPMLPLGCGTTVRSYYKKHFKNISKVSDILVKKNFNI